MTARATFKQSDVARAVKGVEAAGLNVARVIVVDGRIEVIVGESEEAPHTNPLDRLHGKKT